MKIEARKLSELKPYPHNPRINDQGVDAVANSIREFGFLVPVVLDREDVIVAGHTRAKAAAKLGMEEVPTVKAADLTPAQIKAFRIADNKTADLSTWDLDLLPEELAELKAEDFDLRACFEIAIVAANRFVYHGNLGKTWFLW
jgi:ParB-like chromosome segregation protein Spo0J